MLAFLMFFAGFIALMYFTAYIKILVESIGGIALQMTLKVIFSIVITIIYVGA